jgi:hypothetical protein
MYPYKRNVCNFIKEISNIKEIPTQMPPKGSIVEIKQNKITPTG